MLAPRGTHASDNLYPLKESISNASLLVGWEPEFAEYGKWIADMPHKISKSRVILARKKCGKIAFVQRLSSAWAYRSISMGTSTGFIQRLPLWPIATATSTERWAC